jgi:hypothetical protein
MAFRDLFSRGPAHSDYSGRETRGQRAARKEAADSAKRRKGHRRSATATARQGQAWEDRDRSRFGS